jgi:hypothetical protein
MDEVMDENSFEATKKIHAEIIPRLRFLQGSFAAMAENKRYDDTTYDTSVYDGAVLALDDVIAAAEQLIDMLES